MFVVLDTSAAVEVVLNRPGAKKLNKVLADAEIVVALDSFVSEITNLFLKYHQFESLPADVCETSLERAIALVDEVESSVNLYREAFALSCQINCSVYDAQVLILARRNNAVLLTTDEKLQSLAQGLSIKIS